MKIEVTGYTREDGLTLLRVPGIEGGLWVIRRIQGPAWFWDAEASKWVISIQSGFDLSDYALPYAQARALFETVPNE